MARRATGAGELVQAVEVITEENHEDEVLFTHARPGDVGRVQYVDGDFAMITWLHSGGSAECHESEFKPA